MMVQINVATNSFMATSATKTKATRKTESLTELLKQQPDSVFLVAERNHNNLQWTRVETKERTSSSCQRSEDDSSGGASGCERRKCKLYHSKELSVKSNGHHSHHHHHNQNHHHHNSCLDFIVAERHPLAEVQDANPAPAASKMENCLICRKDNCRGNLYCNMLLAENNDSEVITINRKKSVVQNRRKSALYAEDILAVVVGESAGKCETSKSEGDSGKCSLWQRLHSIYNYHLRPIDRSRTRRRSLDMITDSPSQDNDATNGCTRSNSTCESQNRVAIRGHSNYYNSDLIASNKSFARQSHCHRRIPNGTASLAFASSTASSSPQPSNFSLEGPSQNLTKASVTMSATMKYNCMKAGGYRNFYHDSSGFRNTMFVSPVSHASTTSPVAKSSSTFSQSTEPKSIFRYRSRAPTLTSSVPGTSFNCILWFIAFVMLLNFTISLVVSAAYTNVTSGSTGVCTSIDIRNKAQQLHNLTGCRVIEGFLVITLMDESNQTDFENYTFPELTEITDFLMLYRVSGIRSLAKLFPNLQVIRGNSLFEGFALIIFENANVEEIGLTSLVTINRGGVRIEKNPILCFVHTIDWNRIALNATPETLVFKHNKAINECPLCGSGRVKGDVNSGDCSVSGSKPFCWNQDHCQKICPAECRNRACNSQGKCCNETCLGSCSADGNTCSVCRNLVAYGKNGEKMCVQECPANTYKHMNRRCLTKTECRQIVRPLRSNLDPYPYVPFEGQCLLNCKSGYEKVGDTCVPCHNKCAKQCDGKQILSILDAESLRGCTIIKENLMINIRQGGPHLIEDLENALSSIEEIGGYLKITRTYSIVSLSFFKRLRVIRGEYLADSIYALYVLDNQNLQNLWAENQNVTIERGRIFFHFNPKLCYNKIEALKPFIKQNNTFDVAEVARDSNGDRVACDIQDLEILDVQLFETAALISVKPIDFEDERVFLGYQYFYMEAPYKNVSIYENRHGCGYDSWDVDDDNNKDHRHLFTHLKPYTQYAVYVKTSTIASEKKGGQSKIHYFRTLPSTPDSVRNLEFSVLNYSSIEIRWIEPREPKGNLTEYHFIAEITSEKTKILEQRNYCTERAHSFFPAIKENRESAPEEPKKPAIASEESCRSICKDMERHVTMKALDEPPARENEIDFEDAIQNFVYVRRVTTDDQKRQKRSVRQTETYTDTLPQRSEDDDNDIPPEEELRKIKVNGTYTVYADAVNASTKSFIFTGLKHYSRYIINVRACREGTGKRCSTKTTIYTRTAKKDGADDVQNLTAHIENINNTRNSVRLTWREPPNPNGLIVSYSIKYYRVDIEHAKHVDKCITHREYENSTKGYILYDMDSGNYSVQVMATSLAGDGNYCKPVYFYIKESRLSGQAIASICVGIVLFLLLCAFFIWRFKRRCLPPPDDLKLFTSVNPEYISMQYTPDEWEIPREKIIQLRELGQGSFGMVYEGIVKNLNKDGEDLPCAIKTVNENATDRERINFLNEASVMKAFDTFHVVRLLGVVSRDQPTLVIMELMTNGDLKGYLRSNRPDSEQAKTGEVQVQPPTLKRILQMAIEIADGMSYLSAKKFVHRDLAARNCMVAHDLTVKIGDFGMTRDIYETDYYRKGTKGLLPVRWMSPESLKDGVFSSSSDVFSYGVVLWEMATLASQPYQGLSNDQVLRYVIDGGVMERPENCPDKLYNLMRRCWQHRPSARPTFMEIIEYLLEDANSRFREVSFFHSEHGQEIYRQMQAVPTDVDDTTPLRTDMEVGTGNDDFKPGGTNYLLERSQEPQHSPYSLGSGTAAINSIPDGILKQSNDNSSPSTLTANNMNKDTETTTTTAATVQSFSNSLVPPRLRRIWRNAFLGNGNSNYSNRSCNGAGGGVSSRGAGATSTSLQPEILTSVDTGPLATASDAARDSGGVSNSLSGPSSGLGGIFSGLRGLAQNSNSGSGGSSRFMGKDFSAKGGQKMSQETITNPLLNDTSFDEITLPLPVESKTDVQCNHNDDKAKYSSLSSSNRLNQLSSPSHPQKQLQILQPNSENEQHWLYSNGYVPSSNPAAPLLASKPSPQLYQGVGGSNIRSYASRFSPRSKKANRPAGLGDNLISKPSDDVVNNYRKLLPSPSADSTPQLYQRKPDLNQPSPRNDQSFSRTQSRDGSSTLVRRSPPSTSS